MTEFEFAANRSSLLAVPHRFKQQVTQETVRPPLLYQNFDA